MRRKKILLFVSIGIVLCTIALTPSEGLSKKGFLPEEEYLKLPEEKIDIAEGALIIAKGIYPELDIQKYLDQINAMAKALKPKLKGIKDPERIIQVISDYIYVKEKFEYKMQSVFLNNLLDRRYGACNDFSSLYLSIAQRLNLPFYGVKVPKHLFVRYDDGKIRLNVETAVKGTIGSDQSYIKIKHIHLVSVRNGVYLKNRIFSQLVGESLENFKGEIT